MRNRLVALVVCLGVFSHLQSMAQTNRHFPFNTVGDAYGKIRNNDVRERDADAFDEVANIEDITNPPMDSIRKYVPSVSLPLKHIQVNSPFGVRKDPMNKRTKRIHNGLDLKAKFEEVYSMLPGVVTAASYHKWWVLCDHQSWHMCMLLPTSVKDIGKDRTACHGRIYYRHQRKLW